MKKFIIFISAVVVLAILFDFAYYRIGLYIDFNPKKQVSTFMDTDSKKIRMLKDGKYCDFEIKGVNLGSGEPGEWATDFDIDEETYLRWFGYINEMGANTIRVYTVQSEDFYNALYKYNKDNNDPLYILHGVWVNDYIQNSDRDAYDPDFMDTLINDCRTVVDVIHGNKKISLGRMASAGSGFYLHDLSEWVIGYILGVEWEDVTVSYTDHKYMGIEGYTEYNGKYMYSAKDASPFEVMLAEVGDKIIEYESERYKMQRLIAFSNWPTTDPFDYPQNISEYFMKCAKIDVEHIKTTDQFISGYFASYHVYPYYPDYLSYIDDWSQYGLGEKSTYTNEKGETNTYRAYLDMLAEHHTIPVVISEFGVSTGRGMAQRDQNTGRNQGNMSEKKQGQALIDCYNDIISSGCAGCCVFSWQDEWFKRTWNTMYAVDIRRSPYWSDYQTNEQYFGLLSFDPGMVKSVCYVDGDVSEWKETDLVSKNNDVSVSMKYDEKFIYFLIHKENLDFANDKIFIPIDTTPKTGSTYCKNNDILFNRAADFLITVNGETNSRVQVQERYEALRSNYSQNVNGFDTYTTGNQPEIHSPLFVNIDMILQTATPLLSGNISASSETFETGHLTYGNANPASTDFNSLADFISSGDNIEIKLPWQLLNFADPSKMKIHDDYYDDNYGIDYLQINELYVGAALAQTNERIILSPFSLKGWKNTVTYHERLKDSYYVLQKVWNND